MSPARLREIDGLMMVAIPPTVLEHLKLQSGAMVDVVAEDGRIAITPTTPRRYALTELLEEHEAMSSGVEDTEWTSSEARGRELI